MFRSTGDESPDTSTATSEVESRPRVEAKKRTCSCVEQ